MAAKTVVLLVVAAAATVTGTSTPDDWPDGARPTPVSAASAAEVVPTAAAPERDLLHPSASAAGGDVRPSPTTHPLARPTTSPTAPRPRTAPTRAPHPSVKPRSVIPTPSTTAHRPAATQRPAATARPATRPKPPAATGPTGWPALDAAIGRIPGYQPRGITWTVSSRYGHWGATDMATGWIYISPTVSPGVLDSVVRHEYAHIVTVRAYAGDWRTAKQAANLAFGGTGRTGVERAADCMARALGATFTQYTSCGRADWQAAAGRLLAGRRL